MNRAIFFFPVLLLGAVASAQTLPVTLPTLPVPGTTPQGGTPPGPTLTLDEAVAIAQGNAFGNRIARSATERSRQQYFESQAGLSPNINASANVQRNGRSQSAAFGGQQGGGGGGSLFNETVGLSLTLPLDISGNIGRRINASRRFYAATREGEGATANSIRLNVRQAYFNALRNLAFVGVARQNVANAEVQVRQAELQLAQQFIARIDVERLRSQLAQYQNDALIAENNYQVAVQTLNNVLSRPIETPTTLADPTDLPQIPDDVDRLVEEGEAARPEVLQLRQQIRALELTARTAENGLAPQLSVSLNYQRNLNPSAFSPADTTLAGLNLSVPLFDGGAARARGRAAREDVAQARINLEQVRLSASADIRSALTSLRTAQARLATATTQIGFATEVERLARVRRDAGEATFLEVVDAQTQLALARNSYVTARYDFFTAYAQLQRAVGRDDLLTPLPNLPDGERTSTSPPPLPPAKTPPSPIPLTQAGASR